ncbi:MAG: hypothetical protein ACK5IQ_11395 [Bacteroidales bacterium]
MHGKRILVFIVTPIVAVGVVWLVYLLSVPRVAVTAGRLSGVWRLESSELYRSSFIDSSGTITLYLYPDSSCTIGINKKEEYGVWAIDEGQNQLYVYTDNFHTKLTVGSLRVAKKSGKMICPMEDGTEMKFDRISTYDSVEQRDSHYPMYNMWRLKPKASEDDRKIRLRLQNILMWSMVVIKEAEDNVDAISRYDSVGFFVKGRIHFKLRMDDLFYSRSESSRALKYFENYMDMMGYNYDVLGGSMGLDSTYSCLSGIYRLAWQDIGISELNKLDYSLIYKNAK